MKMGFKKHKSDAKPMNNSTYRTTKNEHLRNKCWS